MANLERKCLGAFSLLKALELPAQGPFLWMLSYLAQGCLAQGCFISPRLLSISLRRIYGSPTSTSKKHKEKHLYPLAIV